MCAKMFRPHSKLSLLLSHPVCFLVDTNEYSLLLEFVFFAWRSVGVRLSETLNFCDATWSAWPQILDNLRVAAVAAVRRRLIMFTPSRMLEGSSVRNVSWLGNSGGSATDVWSFCLCCSEEVGVLLSLLHTSLFRPLFEGPRCPPIDAKSHTNVKSVPSRPIFAVFSTPCVSSPMGHCILHWLGFPPKDLLGTACENNSAEGRPVVTACEPLHSAELSGGG